jgi:2-polyprenyl-3-methyl-5-hydroxy-6-metoxy-1,4-benzoquinol methylase
MDKAEIISFFNHCAPTWDAHTIRNEPIISTILDNAGIQKGISLLDVACGTGVLFPDYMARGVSTVTAIDISPKMVHIAREKFPQIQVICGDIETAKFETPFDVIMVYNAFPHFPDPEKLISVLAGMVRPGGRLSIAHNMSRRHLTQLHSGEANHVSRELLHEDDLSALMLPYFQVDVKISTDQMYQVSGTRKKR